MSPSRPPARMRVGTSRRPAGSVRSIVLAARTSFRIVCGRQARSSCIASLTASPDAPGANRIFFAVEKKRSFRRGPGRYGMSRSPQPSAGGSFTQLETSTRPLTRSGRFASSAHARAVDQKRCSLGGALARQVGDAAPARELDEAAGTFPDGVRCLHLFAGAPRPAGLASACRPRDPYDGDPPLLGEPTQQRGHRLGRHAEFLADLAGCHRLLIDEAVHDFVVELLPPIRHPSLLESIPARFAAGLVPTIHEPEGIALSRVKNSFRPTG